MDKGNNCGPICFSGHIDELGSQSCNRNRSAKHPHIIQTHRDKHEIEPYAFSKAGDHVNRRPQETDPSSGK